MAFKNIEDHRKYHNEYTRNLRRTNPEKAKPKRRSNYAKDRYAKDPSKQLTSSAKWRLANPDKVRASDRRGVCRKFGITVEDYDKMNSKQNGLCAICGKRDTANRALAVDHCHITNEVRGLLCGKCNKALGGFDDDCSLLRSALDYILASRRSNG